MTKNRLTDAGLDAIRERLAAATPGPWERSRFYSYNIIVPALSGKIVVRCGATANKEKIEVVAESANGANTDFIAHAPTDVAALLAEVDRLRAVLEEEINHE